jgi:hypothetical protein
MSLLKLRSESGYFPNNIKNNCEIVNLIRYNRKIIKGFSTLLLSIAIDSLYSQISSADQLPKNKTPTLLTREYTYSNDCYYCFEKPTLTGNLNNQIKQLRTYMKNKEIVFLSKYRFAPEVVKYDMEMAEFSSLEKQLLRQLRKNRK